MIILYIINNSCLYVCMYVCMCVCVCVLVSILCVCMYVCMYACMYVWVCGCGPGDTVNNTINPLAYTFLHGSFAVFKFVYKCSYYNIILLLSKHQLFWMYICIYVCMYVYMYVCIYVCMYIMYVCMYVCMYVIVYIKPFIYTGDDSAHVHVNYRVPTCCLHICQIVCHSHTYCKGHQTTGSLLACCWPSSYSRWWAPLAAQGEGGPAAKPHPHHPGQPALSHLVVGWSLLPKTQSQLGLHTAYLMGNDWQWASATYTRWMDESALTFSWTLYANEASSVVGCTGKAPWAGIGDTLWHPLSELTVLAKNICDTPTLVPSLEILTQASILTRHGLTLINVHVTVRTLK